MNMTIRQCAVSVLIAVLLAAGCGKKTADLIKDLSSQSYSTRLQAAAQLQTMKEPGLTGKLIALLDSKDQRLQYIVVQILGSRGDTLAIAPLGKASKYPHPYIRAEALKSIGIIGKVSGLPYLVEGLKDPKPMVRYAAVTSIGYLQYPPAAKILYPILRDPADSVRTAAIRSLFLYRNIPGSGVLAADFAISVNDPSPLVRFVAVQALGGGFSDSTTAGELLVEALRDENKFVRIEAIVSIGKIQYAKAAPTLKEMFDTASVDEEVAISEVLKNITGETYPPPSKK
jgi:HEAT repeat protein